MKFIVKIYTPEEKFKEVFDVRRDAMTRAIEIMDAGTYTKTTRRGVDGEYYVRKTTVINRVRGKIIAVNTADGMRFDGVEQERLLKIKDDERMEQKRLWRVSKGLE